MAHLAPPSYPQSCCSYTGGRGILFVFRAGEGNMEKTVCYRSPRGVGYARPHRAKWGGTGVSWEAEQLGRPWPRAIIVVFVGRNRQGRLSR